MDSINSNMKKFTISNGASAKSVFLEINGDDGDGIQYGNVRQATTVMKAKLLQAKMSAALTQTAEMV